MNSIAINKHRAFRQVSASYPTQHKARLIRLQKRLMKKMEVYNMVERVSKKEINLFNPSFKRNEVEFNILCKIIEDDNTIAFQDQDINIIALQSLGKSMWIWINEKQLAGSMNATIDELCSELEHEDLQCVSGNPKLIELFAKKYSDIKKIEYNLGMGMIAYHCPVVIKPRSVVGRMVISNGTHIDTIAEFLAGIHEECYDEKVTKESQIESASGLIESTNLYLWEANNKIVGMANIAHRSTCHGRINAVFTSAKKRNNGYATGLIAEISLLLHREGLTPMLYTDDKNPVSNKIYMNLGYIQTGRIQDIRFTPKDI
ncbi:GNAT family N-acetyltransferase [soil metagenome]